ncbi:SDR family NAD(P)-dependent oxidoreductase [Thioalkalivibrio sp. HK1]|uniref:SDR family NAD(P)-dependent oxidoreductase n=1 Tax=Thioalkalivibrio sp. HK1 TaxID=1469245 RepID=UPI00046FAAC7|nr:SDR family NAD(P)-dependent oxidoreductase [Thioalkalivibrio sp. HK1]
MTSDRPVVIITGASRGIGAACARALSPKANLVLAARSDLVLESTANECSAQGAQVKTVVGDVARNETACALADRAQEAFGRIDAVIANAGILTPFGSLESCDAQAIEYALAVNIVGPTLLARATLPALRASKGRLINVSSGAGNGVIRGWATYCAAKAALNHLTRVIAADVPEVTAIAFSPGMTDTDMQAQIRDQGDKGMPSEELSFFQRTYAEGGLRDADEVGKGLAALALFAKKEWSGEYIDIADPRIAALG